MSVCCGEVERRVVSEVESVHATAAINQKFHDSNVALLRSPVQSCEAMVVTKNKKKQQIYIFRVLPLTEQYRKKKQKKRF